MAGPEDSHGNLEHRIDDSVALSGVNLGGDDQADRSVHGGEDKAVYAYAIEDYAFWAGTETFEVHPGLFGVNRRKTKESTSVRPTGSMMAGFVTNRSVGVANRADAEGIPGKNQLTSAARVLERGPRTTAWRHMVSDSPIYARIAPLLEMNDGERAVERDPE